MHTQDNIHARCPRWRRLPDGACRLEHHDGPLFPFPGNPSIQTCHVIFLVHSPFLFQFYVNGYQFGKYGMYCHSLLFT